MKTVRPLLACGVAGSALWLATDGVASKLADGYNVVQQSISDLNAAGAPTRTLVFPMLVTSDLLFIAFGAGVLRAARGNRPLRATGALVVANGVISLLFASLPRKLDEPTGSPANVANTVVGAATVLCLLLAMGFGGVALRGWFRVVSFAPLLAFLGLTFVGLAIQSGPAAASRTPTIGAQERMMAYTFVAWIALLAVALWRREQEGQGTASKEIHA